MTPIIVQTTPPTNGRKKLITVVVLLAVALLVLGGLYVFYASRSTGISSDANSYVNFVPDTKCNPNDAKVCTNSTFSVTDQTNPNTNVSANTDAMNSGYVPVVKGSGTFPDIVAGIPIKKDGDVVRVEPYTNYCEDRPVEYCGDFETRRYISIV